MFGTRHWHLISSELLQNFKQRFASVLNVETENFNSLPAAACLLDPTVAIVLLGTEFLPLLTAAKQYICSQGISASAISTSTAEHAGPPALKKVQVHSVKNTQ